MSTPALTIHRLSVTTHPDGDPERVSRLLHGMAEHRLDRALTAVVLPSGTWCIRRLDVPVRLDLTRGDPALEAAWAAELVNALLRALARGSPEVVRYHRDLDAIADLICGATTGCTERDWAWARIGLLGPSDPPPARDPGAAILAALRRRPELALGAVTIALQRVGLPPLHRVLGPTGWIAMASIVVAAAGGDASLLSLASTGVNPSSSTSTRVSPLPRTSPRASPLSSTAIPPTSARPRDHETTLAQDGADTRLGRTLVAASRLVEAVRRSRLRPDLGTVKAWAVLVVAEADTSVLRRRSARGVVAAVEQALAHAVGAAWATSPEPSTRHISPDHRALRSEPENPPDGQPAPGDAKPADRVGEPRRHDAAAVDVADVPALARAPVSGDESHSSPRHSRGVSQWAGLLFLLATAADAGIPDAVLDDLVFASRPLPWVLQGVAVCLGLPVADPAVAVFAGVDPSDRPPWEIGLPATEAQRHRLTAIAERWAAVTAEALARDDLDSLELVTSVMRRRGLISYQPGWIEIELSLDQVDVAVRRAGLDLDPGWVPWLGAVVRFVYV